MITTTNLHQSVNGWPLFKFEGTELEIQKLCEVYFGDPDGFEPDWISHGPHGRASIELDIVWGTNEGCPPTPELSALSIVRDVVSELAAAENF